MARTVIKWTHYCSPGDGVSRLLVRHRCHLLQQVVRSNDSAVAGCDQTRHHVLRHRRLHLRQLQLQRLLHITHPVLDSALDGCQCSGFTSCCCQIKDQLNLIFLTFTKLIKLVWNGVLTAAVLFNESAIPTSKPHTCCGVHFPHACALAQIF